MLSTLVIVALQDSRKVFSFLLTTDCVSLNFFQVVGRGWPFLSFWPIIFSFSPGRRFEILLSLVPGRVFFLFFFLVPWMLVDIRLVNIYIYIYIYIYACVCARALTRVCVCVWSTLSEKDSKKAGLKNAGLKKDRNSFQK